MRADRQVGALALALAPAPALVGCQPWDEGEPPAPCVIERPAPGEIRVEVVGCTGQVPPDGEGRTGADVLLANQRWRAVIRHPLDALTARGLGGGTVVDVAPWAGADLMHEVIPIVGGGWLERPEMTVLADGISLTGVVGALPELPSPAALGETRTVRYRVVADAPYLEIEGASGLWIHPRGDVTRFDGLVVAEGRAAGGVGPVTDLGGAYVVAEADRLYIGDDVEIWGAVAPTTRRISGTAPQASSIALLRGGAQVGRVSLAGPPRVGAFSFLADAAIDGVRAEAPGWAPSPVAALGDDLVRRDLALELGGRATLELRPVWRDGLAHWFRADWTSTDGRSGREALDPAGGTLALGAGAYDLQISAGPAFAPLALRIELAPEADLELPIRLPLRIPAGPYVAAGFRRPADRSRDWRGSNLTAARAAAADGLTYATFAPIDDAAGVVAGSAGFPLLRFRNGVLERGDGYTIAAWPFASSSRDALHGAPQSAPRSPLDDAAVLWGGGDDARTLHVDLQWLALAGAPFAVAPAPELVELGPAGPGPGAAADRWAPWLAWLDASRPLAPTGPVTWVGVPDPALASLADVEQGLIRGAVCAGNGPLVTLLVDGVPPGEQLPAPAEATGDTGPDPATPATHTVFISVAPLDGIDRLVLLAAHGQRIDLPPAGQLLLEDIAVDGPWLAAAAWSDRSDVEPQAPWAVTAPVWLAPPAAPAP